jgi:hypothetical protein
LEDRIGETAANPYLYMDAPIMSAGTSCRSRPETFSVRYCLATCSMQSVAVK